MEPLFNARQDETYLAVKIKEEVTEDTIPSPDSFLDGDDQNSAEIPSMYQNEDFVYSPEKIIIKPEYNFIEENDSENNHPSFDYMEANKEMRLTENCPVNQPHTASVCSNSSIKRTLQDYTEDASNENQVTAKHRKAQFTSSPVVRECAPPQADWMPFEFVDISATVKKEVTDSGDCVDKNTSSPRPMHTSPSTSSSRERSAPSNEKKFSCKQCPARFKRKFNLQVHLLIHSSQRPFSCEQCSARFKTKISLEKHYC